MEFEQILRLAEFSHNTPRLHLDLLTQRDVIVKDKQPVKGRGKPRFVYSMSIPKIINRK